jgi:hypothetical protein
MPGKLLGEVWDAAIIAKETIAIKVSSELQRTLFMCFSSLRRG